VRDRAILYFVISLRVTNFARKKSIRWLYRDREHRRSVSDWLKEVGCDGGSSHIRSVETAR
jgi:hypothetical protein